MDVYGITERVIVNGRNILKSKDRDWDMAPLSFNCNGAAENGNKRMWNRHSILFRINRIKEFEGWREYNRNTTSSFSRWL